jgi:hypothetical protein
LHQSAPFWTTFLPKLSFGRSTGRASFLQNEPICTPFWVLNEERCSILLENVPHPAGCARDAFEDAMYLPTTRTLALLRPFSCFPRAAPHLRQQLPCMAGVTTDAANRAGSAGSAGKGLGWNQAELLAVTRAAPVVHRARLSAPTKIHPCWGGVFSRSSCEMNATRALQSAHGMTNPTLTRGVGTKGAPRYLELLDRQS